MTNIDGAESTARHGRDPSTAFPLALADRCVRCALCLPRCPTYQLSGNEAESPRGRIALMQGLASGRLPADERIEAHLAGCLGCRACEAVCPADVPFGRLIDAGRLELARRGRGPGYFGRFIAAVAARRQIAGAAARLARIWQRSTLRKWTLPALPDGLRRAESLLPPLVPAPQWRPAYRHHGPHRGRVSLFLGCVAPALDPTTTADAIRVLTRSGFDVSVPARQVCCGALHQHSGMERQAARRARRNVSRFPGHDPIVTTASGCAATLLDYGRLAGTRQGNGARGDDFAARVVDVSTFLAARFDGSGMPDTAIAAPRGGTVAVHDPCSLRNVLNGAGDVHRLLAASGFAAAALPGNDRCCGAAGAYLLTHPGTADALAAQKRDGIRGCGAETVVTSNIGCALQLRAALGGAGPEVVHPVTLLARSIGAAHGVEATDPRPQATAGRETGSHGPIG